jgi:tRNA A37 threonylcarbamoyladenosine modification protein TsaB
VSTQVASSRLAESEPPMWGMATLAMEVSSASMKVARVTVMAMTQGLARGRHVSWKDAHRGQFYCGMYGAEGTREMLLTAGEINAMGGLAGRVAVCEETVAQLLEELYGEPELMRVSAPNAGDALRFSLEKWRAGEFADVAALDGYYLRGADAKVSARS